MNPQDILQVPAVQYGFAGMCMVLLAVVIWLTRRLLALLETHSAVMREIGKIIEASTKLSEELKTQSCDQLTLQRSIRDMLLARPCIARREEGGGG